MALVDEIGTSNTHEDVLGVIGHPYHLMGNNLPDGKDKVERGVQEHPVHLDLHAIVEFSFGDFLDI